MKKITLPAEDGGQLRFTRCAIADTIRVDVVESAFLGGERLATAYVTVAQLRKLADDLECA